MDFDREQRTALEAVTAAVRLCERVRRTITPAAMEKNDKSPVTVADYGAQALICRTIGDAFPDDPIVGEEDASALQRPDRAEQLKQVVRFVGSEIPGASPDQVLALIDRGNGAISSRFWTLDPVDGTKGFLRNDQYAVALALIKDGTVTVGVLGCPSMPAENGTTGVLYGAVRGRGAFMHPISGGDSIPLRVAGTDDSERLRFVESVEHSHSDQQRHADIARTIGIRAPSLRIDSQAKYGVVASGQAAVYLRLPSPATPGYRENIWDHAAGALIVEEAGGRVSDMHGMPLDYTAVRMERNRGVIATNGTIHDRVLEALAVAPNERN